MPGRGYNSNPNNHGGQHQTWYDGDLRYSQDTDRNGNVIPGSGHYRVNSERGASGDPFRPVWGNFINSGFDPGFFDR